MTETSGESYAMSSQQALVDLHLSYCSLNTKITNKYNKTDIYEQQSPHMTDIMVQIICERRNLEKKEEQ